MDGTVEVPGPWRHRHVAANGARFHVAEATPASHGSGSAVGASGARGAGGPAARGRDEGPLVLFLHGFPEFWWAWRAQLPAVAAAGYRAVAMDLRGYGTSDKTPRGYDPVTLARDVAGVVRSLGAADAVLVGQGWGGYVAWAAAVLHQDRVRGLVSVSATHPRRLPSLLRSRRLSRHLLGMQVPWFPERTISSHRAAYVESLLQSWSGPTTAFPSPDEVARYRGAMSLWPSPHCALEYHRWVVRSRLRTDGRRFSSSMRTPVTAPVLQVLGDQDAVVPIRAARVPSRLVAGPLQTRVVAGSGHFPHEECPDEFTALLLDWLGEHRPTATA